LFSKIAELFIFGIAPLVIGMLAAPAASLAAERTISGEVFYRERIALPANAVLTVQLADVSLADAPAAIVGKQVVDPAGQVPIKFTISFDPAVIRPNTNYALEARITVDDTLWFINDIRHELDPLDDAPQSMVLKMVRSSEMPPSPTIFGITWLVEEVGGTPIRGQTPSTFTVGADGKVSGRGPCNSYFGTAQVGDGTIEIGEIGSTFMACEPDVMEQEKAFLEALRKAAGFRISEGKLTFADTAGKDILRLSAGS
jgi:putative lipoprotein